MMDKIKEAITRYNMLQENDVVAVAVSGGADSIALLHALHSLKHELGITVVACHVNHNLRGEESMRDAQFVEDFCSINKIPVTFYSIEVKADKHESVEERARKMRYECFDKICNKLNAKLATAHTASDNAETVFLNILRGTGTKGLCGIPPVRDNIIRPLLRCTREEIENYCKENNLSFVTDSSNLSDDYTRNKLRHRLIPLLLEFNPSLFDGISRMTSAVYDDNALLETISSEAKQKAKNEDGYSCEILSRLERTILCRVVSSILSDNGIEPSSLRINECVQIILDKKGKINLCKNKFAVVRKKTFRITYEEQQFRHKTI